MILVQNNLTTHQVSKMADQDNFSQYLDVSDLEVTDFSIQNEPVLSYLPGSKERQELEAALNSLADVTEDIPIVIGGKEYRTEHVQYQPMVNIYW